MRDRSRRSMRLLTIYNYFIFCHNGIKIYNHMMDFSIQTWLLSVLAIELCSCKLELNFPVYKLWPQRTKCTFPHRYNQFHMNKKQCWMSWEKAATWCITRMLRPWWHLLWMMARMLCFHGVTCRYLCCGQLLWCSLCKRSFFRCVVCFW